MLSFFPRGVLDEILDLIESVSEEFPSYSCKETFLEHVRKLRITEMPRPTLKLAKQNSPIIFSTCACSGQIAYVTN